MQGRIIAAAGVQGQHSARGQLPAGASWRQLAPGPPAGTQQWHPTCTRAVPSGPRMKVCLQRRAGGGRGERVVCGGQGGVMSCQQASKPQGAATSWLKLGGAELAGRLGERSRHRQQPPPAAATTQQQAPCSRPAAPEPEVLGEEQGRAALGPQLGGGAVRALRLGVRAPHSKNKAAEQPGRTHSTRPPHAPPLLPDTSACQPSTQLGSMSSRQHPAQHPARKQPAGQHPSRQHPALQHPAQHPAEYFLFLSVPLQHPPHPPAPA